jgi:hypothetical protein
MEVSAQVYAIYLRYVSSQDAWPYSVDEAFLDVTPYRAPYGSNARELAHRITSEVREETGVPATAGIGPNMFLCKVAPWGVWPQRRVAHRSRLGARALYHRGRAGLRAQGTIALQRPGAHARLRLWRGARCAARDGLAKLSRPQAAGARMRHDGTLRGTLGAGRTFRARWWTEGPWTPDCWRAGGDRGAFALYDQTVARDLPIRRVCLWLGGVAPAAVAVPTLFDDPTADAREARLAGAVTRTRRRFGPNTVLSGTSLLPAANARERNLQIGGHRA